MADAGPNLPSSTGRRLRTTAIAGAVALVVAAGTVAGLDATGHLEGRLLGHTTSTPSSSTPAPRPAAPAVLTPAGSTAAAPLTSDRLRSLLDRPALGPAVGATVLDAATGDVLLDQDAATPRTPASIAKLTTAAAALTALGPGRRLVTRVVAGASTGEVVLVGGGDASLTVRKARPTDYPKLASLTTLADATSASLRTAGQSTVTVGVDDSLFSGPAVAPDWPASYIRSGVVSPVSALSVDAGRVRPGANAREPDPAVAAGRDLARLLTARGITVTGTVRRTPSPAGAQTLAEVLSPTVAELVEADLSASDNDLAEALLRLVAVARDQPGSFADGIAVTKTVLTELGVPVDGLDLRDGSGLARSSAVAPVTLARLLQVAAGPAHPALRTLLTGLPVAGFSGTLTDRFTQPPSESGAGVVRAKTGTLTGVSTLAGLTERGGRTVLFVVMSDQVPVGGTVAARDGLDRFAAAVAR